MKRVHVELLTKDVPSGLFGGVGHETFTDAAGAFRLGGLDPGRYYLCGTAPSLASGSAASGYAPTCYPGTATLTDAQLLVIARAESRDVSLAMIAPTRLASVSGTAIDASGQPLSGGFVLLSGRAGFPRPAAAPIQANGAFTIAGIPPGEYALRTQDVTTRGPGYQYRPDVSVAAVSVHDEDVTGVVLAPVKAVAVSGRLIVPAGSAASVQSRFIRIGTISATPLPLVVSPPPAAVVGADLTFQFSTPALPMFIQVQGAGSLIANAVRVGGRNVIDTPIDFQSGRDVGHVEIELTESPSLTATAIAPGAVAASDWCLLVFPQDRNKWTTPDFPGRSFAALWHIDARPFAIRTLAPGRYYAVALNRFENGWRDPDFLSTLRSRALAFELGDAERRTLRLQLITLP
jgi:hypothetical protein